MKILHLAFVDTAYGQILQKIDQQFAAFKQLNSETHCRVIGINNRSINLDKFAFDYTDLQKVEQKVSRIKYFNACEKEIHHYKPDIVYFRYPYFDSYALDFVKAHDNVVFENQTIAEYEFPVGKAEIEKKYGPLILGHSRGIVGVTEEILNYELKRAIGSPPGYVMTNGIDVNSLPLIDDKPKTNEINLFCAAHFSYWHGIDRLIYGLSQYDMNPPVILHLVGHGPELNTCAELVRKFNLERHIKLYGFLEKEKLSQIAQVCDVGVGPMAIHRKGINESCSLKTREFCLRGLPFIYSGKDADFEDTLPFVQQIASTDDPIDIETIVDFAKSVQQNPQIRYQERKYAIENLSWTFKIRGLIDFLNTLSDMKRADLQNVVVPKSVDFYISEINKALNSHNLSKAERLSKTATTVYNFQPDLWFVRGTILRLMGKISDAIFPVRRSIELLETPEALLELLRVYHLLNAENSAQVVRQHLLSKYPDWEAQILKLESNLFEKKGSIDKQKIRSKEETKNLSANRIDKTVESHLDAHNIKQDNCVLEYYEKIQKLIESGQEAQAIAALENFIRDTDNFALAYNDLGVLYYRSGNIDTAEKFYRKAVALNPQSIAFKKNLADLCYVEFKKTEEALQLYVDILSLKPQDVETLLTVAHICIELNKFEDAKYFYNQILEIEPWNQEANASLEKLENTNNKIDVKPDDVEKPQLNKNTQLTLKIAFYALRELHLPVLLPVYHELKKMGIGNIGFMAPPYRESDDVVLQEGLSDRTLQTLKESGTPFWGHEPKEPFDCVVVADVCYDRVDGWGPVVCIGHGTISKGIFFSKNPVCRRENFATVLCVPGPWYRQSFGNEVITHIAPTGFSKMDELAIQTAIDTDQLLSEIGFSHEKKTILFAPTFNPELTALEMLRPEWSKLDSRKYQVIFKLHGATHQHIKNQYKELAATQSNFYTVSDHSIAPFMHACDILVSDVSSVYVEFFALGKPIILVNNPQMQNYAWYDPDNIEHQVRDAAYQINTGKDIHKILQRLEHSDPLQQKRSEYAKQLFPPLDGQNSKRIAEQIIKVAAGDIRLTVPADHRMNVYLPCGTQNVEQIEDNLNRTSGPVTLYTHEPNISHIGKVVVNRLAENEVPPTPLICLTGQYVLPHHWDYTWYLIDHFNRTTGVFAPLTKDQVDDRYLQNGPVSEKLAAVIHNGLQAHHKVHKSVLGQIKPTPTLSCDGLIITDGVEPQFIRSLLKEIRNPAQTDIATEEVRKAGYATGQLADFYCYAKSNTRPTYENRILALTARLKAQRGNIAVAEELKSLLLNPRPKLSLSNCPKRVSVIIPYYQQLDTVEETLISICHQTYQNIEIIFVNDGSDDEQAVIRILNNVAQQYPNVQINYYYKDNSGLADTRNFGIDKACGDYILPLDSDDLIASTFLEKTVAVLDQNPSVSFVYTEVLFWGAKNEIWGTIDFDPKVLLTQNLMTCTTLFRKEMWQHIGGYDLNMKHGYEDWNFWIAAVESGFDGANLHLPLFLYRRKKNSMLENRVYYDPIAKEQIVRNHQALYKEITPETLNQLRQFTGIVPSELVKDANLAIPKSTGEHAVKPTLPGGKFQTQSAPSAKILFVCHDFPPYKYAGAQLYASNLAKELNLSGFDTRIFYPVDISQRQTNENRALYDIVESTYDGLPVYQVNIDEKNNPAKFWQYDDLEIARQFEALLLAEKFEIVHFHLLYRLSSSLPKVAQALGVASICTLHDYWLLCPLGHMVDSKMRACSGPESALKCAHCVCGFNREPDCQLVEYFTHRQKAMKDAYERIDTKISPSTFLAQTHSNFGYSKPRVLPLGWLPIQKENNRETDETVVFGYCGQIISRKGLDILIEALDRLPHRNWKLQIYGEGYDAQYLGTILDKIKHNPQIEYLGAFTSEDLPRIYSEIDVAVIPSRRENYPLTLLEALSARVPVVAADVGGISEMMQDRVQGFLFPQDSVEGLTSALCKILENPEIIPKMKRQIQPIKTIQQNAAEIKDIYQALSNAAKKAENSMNKRLNQSMQAVILAAGRGSRLGNQNGDRPKCLVEIGEKTILERQIQALKAVGVDDIYVVVGYKKELVKQVINAKFDNITFIENDIYATTNTIYSLYLTIPHLSHDFFYLNGDVLFRNDLLETLIAEPGSGMAVEQKTCGDEEVKVKLDGRRICSISKKVPIAESIGEFIGVGIFRKDIHEAFFENLRHAVEEDCIVNDYFEYALDKTVHQAEIISVDITGEPVIEIDFPEDLENAKLLAQKIDKDFKASETPAKKESIPTMEKLTSIIILTRNQLAFTQKCINSILEHTQRPYELIVVDNGSDDGTVNYIESTVIPQNRHLPIRIIKNQHNLGFAAGNNQGIAVAKGDYILLMNNDIVVTPQWLDLLIACAEQRPRIGIVGPRSNCVSGPQLIDVVSYDTQTLQGLNLFADGFARTNRGQSQQALRVVGFCMFIKRSVIDKIGGMDDRYGLGNFEDDDFSLRAAIAGFESWIAMDCFIHHFGSRTFVGEKIDYRQSLMRNWEIFKSKWGLPKDLPYGSAYGLPQMKNTTFDASIHTYPLNSEDRSNQRRKIDFHAAEDQYRRIHQKLKTLRPDDAISELEKLVGAYPEFALAFNDLGVLYYQRGHKQQALYNYETAVKLDPQNTIFLKNLADFYFIEFGRVEDALKIYHEILEVNPKDVETLMISGHISVSRHQFEQARIFYQQVLEIEPSNPDAQTNLARLNQLGPVQPEGKTAEEMYREIQPRLNNGDPHKAIASLTQLLDHFPEFAVAHNDLGVLYYHTGDKEKAQVHYDRAVQLAPDNINFKKNLADFCCIELGRIEDALQIYVNILKTDPQDVETLMATAQICKALEKFDDARDFFNQVLQIEPSNAEARWLLSEMEKPPAQMHAGSPAAEDAYDAIQQRLNAASPHEAITEGRLDPADDVRHDSTLTAKVEAVDADPATRLKPDTRSNTKVSIVVDLKGIQNRVKECIKSIQLNTDAPFELLLINNGASKGILKWARQLTAEHVGYQILDCQRHMRWAESINNAVQKASGECVVLIHNDVVMPSGWLESFRACLNRNLHTGVVGPMTNCAALSRQVIQLVESGRADFESQATDFKNNNRHRRVKTQILSDFCLVFRKALVERIGGFDEQFVSETISIEDFCNRASASGCQNFITADTYVYHYGRHNAQNGSAMKNSASDEDRRKYSKKWVDSQNPYVDDYKMIQLITRAHQSSQKGQIDSAVETLLAAIGTHPDDQRIYYALAEILLAAKRFQDAKETLSEMPISDDNPEPLFLQLAGYAEEGLANYPAAQTCVEQLLAIDPDDAHALNLKGILAYHHADRKSAEKYFRQALAVDPGYGEPHTNLGMLQLEASQPEAALKSFEISFRLCPTDLDIATNYHSLVAEMACYAKAETVVREAACLYPNNQKIAYMFIDFLIQQGKHEAAMQAIEDAIAKFGSADGILAAALKIRERLGPMTISAKKPAQNPPVSVCMIIKDEEKYLARCLASVKPLVDEMIVVDTGSTDRSKDIAAAFGARVYDYEWKNDFAAARNFSISKAAGEWIFILDGDEVISRLDYDDFKKIVKQKPKAPIAYNITTRNYNPLANVTGWVPNDGKYPDEETTIGWLPSEKVRLFYGKDQIWFEGAVHELVDPVLKRYGIEIKNCGMPVHHYGRLDQTKLDRKGEIYFEIGQKKLSEMGEDVHALRELAVQATILERNREALDLWHRLLEVNPFPELSAIAYVNMGTIYSRLEQFEDALEVSKKALGCDPDLKEAHYNYAVAELHCGNAPAAIDTLEKLLHGFPDYPPAQFMLCAAYCCAEQKQKGLEGIQNQKNTPVGAHLAIPCLELGNSLVAAKQIRYALAVLGAAIECDIVNKEILDLFTVCIKLNDQAHKLNENVPAAPTESATVLVGNLPQ